MKRVLFAFSLLLATVWANAAPNADERIYLDSSSTNIPSAYSSASAGSKLITFTKGVIDFCLHNGTAEIIGVNYQNGTSATAPSADNITLAPGTGVCKDKNIGAALYVHSLSGGAISSGKLTGGVTYSTK